MINDFKEKIFIVTGASSGIGKATALTAVERGAAVSFVARREQELEKICSGMPEDRVEIIKADLTSEQDRQKTIRQTVRRFGAIDVLVNAAGIIGSGSIAATSPEFFNSMLEINLFSLFRLTQLALPHLIERKGNIINVSSVAGIRAFPNLLAYCVSKAAVDQLTRCAALDLAPQGVRVNSVNPGVVLTNLHRNSGLSEEDYQQFLKRSTETHPLGRVGTPEEVAELILFLASHRAGWITGGNFSIDGGRAQTCAR